MAFIELKIFALRLAYYRAQRRKDTQLFKAIAEKKPF
jgi:hypothetical protein